MPLFLPILLATARETQTPKHPKLEVLKQKRKRERERAHTRILVSSDARFEAQPVQTPLIWHMKLNCTMIYRGKTVR